MCDKQSVLSPSVSEWMGLSENAWSCLFYQTLIFTLQSGLCNIVFTWSILAKLLANGICLFVSDTGYTSAVDSTGYIQTESGMDNQSSDSDTTVCIAPTDLDKDEDNDDLSTDSDSVHESDSEVPSPIDDSDCDPDYKTNSTRKDSANDISSSSSSDEEPSKKRWKMKQNKESLYVVRDIQISEKLLVWEPLCIKIDVQ